MPEQPVKKDFDILKEAEKISQKQEIGEPSVYIEEPIRRDWRAMWRYQIPAVIPKDYTFSIWRELLEKTRMFPRHEFLDDVSELRKEVDDQKLMIKHLTTAIEELSRKVEQRQSISQTTATLLDSLCKAYIEMISKIDIVKKLYIVETTNGLVCWTIVDTEPFDSTVLEPIYNAQVKIYKEMKEDLALDFHVLNLPELPDRQELESILPPNARLIWKR